MAGNEVGAIFSLLRRHYKVPPKLLDQLRIALTQEAIKDSSSLRYDRILTGIAVAAKRSFPQFGAGRILKLLTAFDALAGEVQEDDGGWAKVMEWLDNETGIVVQDDPDRFIAEYRGRDWRRQLEIIRAEKDLEERREDDE